jgi:hypothetical protein
MIVFCARGKIYKDFRGWEYIKKKTSVYLATLGS